MKKFKQDIREMSTEELKVFQEEERVREMEIEIEDVNAIEAYIIRMKNERARVEPKRSNAKIEAMSIFGGKR